MNAGMFFVLACYVVVVPTINVWLAMPLQSIQSWPNCKDQIQ